jgi:hypothetical protein
MNVGRGLFRAWILISILWMLGAGLTAYAMVAPASVSGAFQPEGSTWNGKPWEVDPAPPPLPPGYHLDAHKPFYQVMRSPAAENLSVRFFEVEQRYRSQWDNDASMSVVTFPDGSRVYMHAAYSDTDKSYIAGQFWDQRWGRWGYAAGIVAAWAFVPCILLFIFGYSLLWIGRGFKRDAAA